MKDFTKEKQILAGIEAVTESFSGFNKAMKVVNSVVRTASGLLEAIESMPITDKNILAFRKTYNRRPMTKKKMAAAKAKIAMGGMIGAVDIEKILSTPIPKWPLGSIERREAAIIQRDPEAWEKEMLCIPEPHDTVACTAMQRYEEKAENFDLMNYEQVETRFGKCNGRRLYDRFLGDRPNMEHIAALYGTTVAEMKQHSRCIEYERKRRQLKS